MRPSARAVLVLLALTVLVPPVTRSDTVYPNRIARAHFLPPPEVRPKDFAIIKRDGWFHLYCIQVDRPHQGDQFYSEHTFGHYKSRDLRGWRKVGDILSVSTALWDTSHVWAPSYFEQGSNAWLAYTGVQVIGSNLNDNQKTGMASCALSDLDLNTWTRNPTSPVFAAYNVPWALHPDSSVSWVDFRDPFVMRSPGVPGEGATPGWLMYYVTRPATDPSGLTVGLALAPYSSPTSWTDYAELTSTHLPGGSTVVESPHVFQHSGQYYMFVSGSSPDSTIGSLRYLTSSSVYSGWTYQGPLIGLVGTSVDAQHWYASEYLQDGTEEYFCNSHNIIPGSLDLYPTKELDVTEFRRINWSGSTFTLSEARPSITEGNWSAVVPATTPGARRYHSAVFDTPRNRMIVFGGNTSACGGSGSNDVWSLDLASGTWTPLSPSGTAPSARMNHTAVYDAVNQRMIVFGGGTTTGNFTLNDVWSMSLTGTPTWTQLSPTGTAPTLMGYQLRGAYDSRRNRLIVVDASIGRVMACTLGASPAWSTLVSSGGPQLGYTGFSVTYDPWRDRILAFGGFTQSIQGAVYSNALYEVRLYENPPVWRLVTPAGTAPSVRAYSAAVYDSLRQRLLFFGGERDRVLNCSGGTINNEMWELSLMGPEEWVQLSASGNYPVAREGSSAIYHNSDDKVVVFGGSDGSSDLSDTPVFNMWDIVRPSPVTDLTVDGMGRHSAAIHWTIPGDDSLTGTASAFDVRYSLNPINSTNFNSASRGPSGSLGGGSGQFCVEIDGLLPCKTYYFAVKHRDEVHNWSAISNVVPGNTRCTGNIEATCGGGFRARDVDGSETLTEFRLVVSSPNPASQGTILTYDIPAHLAGQVLDIGVFDIEGRRIRTLYQAPASSGHFTVSWDGQTDSGGRAASGAYFIRLRLGEIRQTRSVLIRG